MNSFENKRNENETNKISNSFSKNNNSLSIQFADNRSRTAIQNKAQTLANNSQQVQSRNTMQAMADNRFSGTIQQQAEEELLQGQFEPIQKNENKTGLPDNLKIGMENLSGMSLDHVKVHYNSAKPAAVQAHAYAQGSEIHLASGQEQHLPHELGHVVQQAQGRVQPTTSVGGMSVNDNPGLENEATVMGEKALQRASINQTHVNNSLGTDMGPLQKRAIVTQFGNWIWANGAWTADPDSAPVDPMPLRNGAYEYEYLADAAAVVAPPLVLAINYGAAHGDLHFIAKPTKKKSAWTIQKNAALAMMSQEITNRMQDIVTAARASANGTVALLLIADAPGAIGDSIRSNGIQRFQIQLQADINGGISYHGFPDDQANHTGLGPTRNSLV